MSRWTLRRRLVAVLVGLLVTVAAIIGAVSALALDASLVRQLDERLVESSERALRASDGRRGAGQALDPAGDGRARADDGSPPGLNAPGQGAGTVTLSVDDGIVRAGYIDQQGRTVALDAAQASTLADVPADGQPHTVDLADLGEYRVLATTSQGGGLLVTGLSTQDATTTVRSFLVVEVVVAGLGILVAAVAGGALVRHELRPLQRVAATATRVSELPLHEGEVDLSERVRVEDAEAGTEVGQVGLAVNRLLGHVESALAARHASETQVRQFVADASHELRTPLASIRGYTELVRRMRLEMPPDAEHAIERVESESTRMTTLVEDLLLLARLDAGRPLGRESVDLTALAVDAVADAHVAGPDHVWRLELPGAGEAGDPDDAVVPVVTVGDEDRLHQVLVNLLANARVHTPAGTTVVTTVRRGAGEVEVAVSDDGPGIPDELLPHLFQRFSRGDAARSPGGASSGLGLAIAQAVVTAHGGTIHAESAPGRTRLTVRLPSAQGSGA